VQAVFVRRNGRQTGLNKGKVTMFFYTVLIVASLIVAVAIPLIYYIFTSAGKAISKATVPPAEDNTTVSPGLVNHETRATLAWTTSGWQRVTHPLSVDNSHNSPRRVNAPPQAKAQMQSPWLCREEKSSAVGKAYKVSRRVSAEKSIR